VAPANAEEGEKDAAIAGSPGAFAREVMQVVQQMPQLRVLGGSAGTDERHIAELVQALIQAEDDAAAAEAAAAEGGAAVEAHESTQEPAEPLDSFPPQEELHALQEEAAPEEEEASVAAAQAEVPSSGGDEAEQGHVMLGSDVAAAPAPAANDEQLQQAEVPLQPEEHPVHAEAGGNEDDEHQPDASLSLASQPVADPSQPLVVPLVPLEDGEEQVVEIPLPEETQLPVLQLPSAQSVELTQPPLQPLEEQQQQQQVDSAAQLAAEAQEQPELEGPPAPDAALHAQAAVAAAVPEAAEADSLQH